MATKAQVNAALVRMRSSLRSWLSYRDKLDAAANAGSIPAQRAVLARDKRVELNLANELCRLLCQVVDPSTLPNPAAPDAAADMARIVISGTFANVPAQAGQGLTMSLPLIAILVGAFVIFMAITSWADVAKEREKDACIRAGACTDSGFYMKWGVLGIGTYLVWTKTTMLDFLKGKKGRK